MEMIEKSELLTHLCPVSCECFNMCDLWPLPLWYFTLFTCLCSVLKIKHEAYVVNLDDYSDIGTHRIALYESNNNNTYFDSFGVKHIIT